MSLFYQGTKMSYSTGDFWVPKTKTALVTWIQDYYLARGMIFQITNWNGLKKNQLYRIFYKLRRAGNER